MDRYVDIPSRRMANLAAKYVHHAQMKQIESEHINKINLAFKAQGWNSCVFVPREKEKRVIKVWNVFIAQR